MIALLLKMSANLIYAKRELNSHKSCFGISRLITIYTHGFDFPFILMTLVFLICEPIHSWSRAKKKGGKNG